MGKSSNAVMKYWSRWGQQTLKYHVEIVPRHADGLPVDVSDVSFKWQRGEKLAETDPSPVSKTGSATWNCKLQQVATLYMQPDKTFLPKEYSIELQSVTEKNGQAKRRTIGKTMLDLSDICDSEQFCTQRDLTLELSPLGTVHANITLLWLQSSSFMGDIEYEGECEGAASDMSFVSSDDLNISGESDELRDGSSAGPKLSGTSRRQSSPDSVLLDVSNNPSGQGAQGCANEQMDTRARRRSTGILSNQGFFTLRSADTDQKRKTISWAPSPVIDRERREPIARGMSTPVTKKSAGGDFIQGSLGSCSSTQSADGRALPPRYRDQREQKDPGRTDGTQSSNHRAAVVGSNEMQHRLKECKTSRCKQLMAEDSFSAEPSPAKTPVDKQHYLDMLASSDDEEQENGPVQQWGMRLRGLFSSASATAECEQTRDPDLGNVTSGKCPMTPELLEAESDVNALRSLAARALQEKADMSRKLKKMENRACNLQAKLEAAQMVSGSLKERLVELVTTQPPQQPAEGDMMAELVQSKLKLAEQEFANLELQGNLNVERERTRLLMAKLTKLETKYHIDREAHFGMSPVRQESALSRFSKSLSFQH